jgi:hypothetical protein
MLKKSWSMPTFVCLLVCAIALSFFPRAALAANSDVVPIDWTLLSQGKPTDSDAQRMEGILLNASKYAVNKWYNEDMNFDAQTGNYLDFGGTDEAHIRPPADMVFALAVSLKLGVYDATYTGVSVTDATNIAKKIIRSLAYHHSVNTSGGWGDGWQSASWAFSAGAAGWLMWDDITDATNREYIRKMVEHEANRNFAVRYYRDASGTIQTPGDSGAEENGWNAMLIGLATAMMPNHDNYNAWMDKMLNLTIAAGAMPSDVNNGTVINGKAVSDWIDGSNVNSDGTVVNHGGIHPSYMAFEQSVLSAALLYGMIDKDVPEATKFNQDKIYKAFVELNFSTTDGYNAPGGTIYIPGDWEIYYPQVNDKGTAYIPPHLNEDVMTRAFGLDDLVSDPTKKADYWEDLHGDKVASMQARFTDGHTYLDDTEMSAAKKEEQAAKLYAKAYWAKWIMHQNTVHFTNQSYGTGDPSQLVFHSGFESTTTGQMPSNWTLETSAGGTAAVADFPSTTDKSLKLDDTNTSNVAVSRSFTPITGTMLAEWSMLLPVKEDYYGVQLMNGTDKPVRITTYNGNLNYIDSTGAYVTLQAYNANQWYDIKVIANPGTDKADIYVDGVLKASGADFATAASQIDAMRISTSNPNTGAMYIDDITVNQ